jgi:hypothetical protein
MIIQYECGILITSSKLSLPELVSLIGRAAQPGSHDKDEVHIRSGTPWKTTIWREDARDLEGSLCSQILQLVNDIGPICVEIVSRGAGDIVAELDVVAFYDTYTLTIDLSPDAVAAIAINKLALTISTYPTSFESPASALK